MLSEAFPELCSTAPGEIRCETLPALRHLVVVDNLGDPDAFRRELGDTRCAVDWRETFVWREDGAEGRRVRAYADELQSDDVINLQFTRCAF